MHNLCRVRGFYYFRIKVPVDILHILEIREIKKSLHTKSFKDAKVMSKSYSFRLEQIFTLARCGMLTDEQIQKIISTFMRNTLKNFEDGRVSGANVIDSEDGLRKMVRAYEIMVEEDTESLKFNRLENVQSWLIEAVKDQGVSIDETSFDFKKLCREALKARIEFWQIEAERLKGNYNNDYDSLLKEHLLVQATTPQHDVQVTPVATKSKATVKDQKFSSLVKLFMKEKDGNGNWVPKTVNEYKHTFELFLYVLDDRDIKSYTREDMTYFRDVLSIMPRNLFKNSEYKGRPIAKIIKMFHDKPTTTPLSIKTRNKYMIAVSSFFNWCTDWQYITNNPARKLLTKDPEKRNKKRDVYDRKDLENLLKTPFYTTAIDINWPEHFFIPLIGLFTGCRLGEICKLRTEDVRLIEGVPCFDIKYRTEEERVKSDSSERVIPVLTVPHL